MRRKASLTVPSAEGNSRGKYSVIPGCSLRYHIADAIFSLGNGAGWVFGMTGIERIIESCVITNICRGNVLLLPSSSSGGQKSKDDFILNAQADAKCWVGWQLSKPALPHQVNCELCVTKSRPDGSETPASTLWGSVCVSVYEYRGINHNFTLCKVSNTCKWNSKIKSHVLITWLQYFTGVGEPLGDGV